MKSKRKSILVRMLRPVSVAFGECLPKIFSESSYRPCSSTCLKASYQTFCTKQRWSLTWTKLWRRFPSMLRTPLFLLHLRSHWTEYQPSVQTSPLPPPHQTRRPSAWVSCRLWSTRRWSIAPNNDRNPRRGQNPADHL